MATPKLRDLCQPFANGLLDKARALDRLDLTKHQTAGFVTSMSVDIRKLCDITVPTHIRPEVSQSAMDLAEAMGIDLRRQTYQSQPKFDPGRHLFHYEHMTPVATVVAAVRRAGTVEEVVGLLETGIRVAWITKDENSQLNALGYASKRPDPDAAYAEAGITLMAAP